MPLTDTITSPELTRPLGPFPEGLDPNQDVFFSILFRALERHGLRYCALHAHDRLLYGADFALHPADVGKLRSVFADLGETGFLPVQRLELEPGEFRVVLARVADFMPETVMIDFVTGSRGNVRAEKIVGRRRREGNFWACSEETTEQGAQPVTSRRARMGYWMRKLRDRLVPGGSCLAFLGPDGVGKTTLLLGVSKSLKAVFPEQSIYRWRPAVFARAPRLACLPHSKPLRSQWGSISYLFFSFVDFISGYIFAIRSVLSRGGLVIFDRFYDDLLIDPKRYRYAGPMWLAWALRRVVPPYGILFVVLDAEEQTILSRKQQLPPEEIRRQRRAYREFAAQAPAAVLIRTEQSLEHCRAEALGQIFRHLAAELAGRHPEWFGFGRLEATKGAPCRAINEESVYSGRAGLQPGESLECEASLNSIRRQS